eukprot:4273861-Amphidinium_carterae.1
MRDEQLMQLTWSAQEHRAHTDQDVVLGPELATAQENLSQLHTTQLNSTMAQQSHQSALRRVETTEASSSSHLHTSPSAPPASQTQCPLSTPAAVGSGPCSNPGSALGVHPQLNGFNPLTGTRYGMDPPRPAMLTPAVQFYGTQSPLSAPAQQQIHALITPIPESRLSTASGIHSSTLSTCSRSGLSHVSGISGFLSTTISGSPDSMSGNCKASMPPPTSARANFGAKVKATASKLPRLEIKATDSAKAMIRISEAHIKAELLTTQLCFGALAEILELRCLPSEPIARVDALTILETPLKTAEEEVGDQGESNEPCEPYDESCEDYEHEEGKTCPEESPEGGTAYLLSIPDHALGHQNYVHSPSAFLTAKDDSTSPLFWTQERQIALSCLSLTLPLRKRNWRRAFT